MTATVALLFGIDLGGVEHAVRNASGLLGLFVIFAYSFLIAFVLPFPGEVVLCPAGYVCGSAATLGFGIPGPVLVALVILVSATGKALGSLIALYVGHGASHSGPVVRACRRLGFNPVEWSKGKMVTLVKNYGYYGMALGLSVPGFPDTLSIYVFSVIEKDYQKFAAAAFTGSVGRLLITIAVLEGFLLLA